MEHDNTTTARQTDRRGERRERRAFRIKFLSNQLGFSAIWLKLDIFSDLRYLDLSLLQLVMKTSQITENIPPKDCL